ncbi:MAG: ATP-binding protein, partial [Pseudomonadota bacterium]
ILPTVLLFCASARFITSSLDYWFSARIERSLADSVEVGRNYYAELAGHARRVAGRIRKDLGPEAGTGTRFGAWLEEQRRRDGLGVVSLIGPQGAVLAQARAGNLTGLVMVPPSEEAMDRLSSLPEGICEIQPLSRGEVVRAVLPAGRGRVLVAGYYLPAALVERLHGVRSGYESYRQLQLLKNPIKLSYLITLFVLTLLMVFAAIWFGFYVAKGITGPIQRLAEGTGRVAHGDLDFQLEVGTGDELGMLVDSFNRMTADLRVSHQRLKEAMEELRRRNVEIEEKRHYTEAVLAKVAAGVVSMDSGGRVATMNASAAALLGVDRAASIGKEVFRVMPRELARLLESGREHSGAQVRLEAGENSRSLLVHVSQLGEGERGQGAVVVFEDMSQLEKAQRMAAWREVARRIAHEIKNPLTPIKLSAQRLRRRYLDHFGEDGAIFDECTRMVIDQVEELRRLVNEFSNFARLPQTNPTRTDLRQLVADTLVLYEQAHKGITFSLRQEGESFPPLRLDREQIKRVLINLLDNAVDSMEGRGEIQVQLSSDSVLKMVRIEVRDSGPGIPAEDKSRLFEPYFSTKKTGTGLGLAICSAIVADHNGFIRVRDNEPRGSRFIIELPMG